MELMVHCRELQSRKQINIEILQPVATLHTLKWLCMVWPVIIIHLFVEHQFDRGQEREESGLAADFQFH